MGLARCLGAGPLPLAADPPPQAMSSPAQAVVLSVAPQRRREGSVSSGSHVTPWPSKNVLPALNRLVSLSALIKVGRPILTINQGTVFMVTDERGEIDGGREQGIFAGDTRLLSHHRLYINGVPWTLLTSSTVLYSTVRIELTNPALMTDIGDLAARQIGLTVRRRVIQAIHEDLDLVSFADRPVHFQLEMALRSDFADIFEVRAHQFTRRGNTLSRWNDERHELRTTYTNGDFHRALVFQLVDAGSRPQFANGRVVFDITLEPGQSWHTCACYHLDDGRGLRSARRCLRADETDHDELGALRPNGSRSRRGSRRPTSTCTAHSRSRSRTWARCACTSRTWRATSGCPRRACRGTWRCSGATA